MNFCKEFLCAYANETDSGCQGDSGGPLFLKENERFTQVGIVATGSNNCLKGFVEIPSVFMRVTELKNWIIKHTNNGTEDSDCK